MNLTLSIDDTLLKEARKAAIEKDTTVNAMVRAYLSELVEKHRNDKTAFLDEWQRLMDEHPIDTSKLSESRDELHER